MPRGGIKEGSRGSDPRLLGLTMGGYLIALSGSDPVDQRSTAPRVRPIPKLARLWAELRHVPMKMALRGCKSALSRGVSHHSRPPRLSVPAPRKEAAVLNVLQHARRLRGAWRQLPPRRKCNRFQLPWPVALRRRRRASHIFCHCAIHPPNGCGPSTSPSKPTQTPLPGVGLKPSDRFGLLSEGPGGDPIEVKAGQDRHQVAET